MFTQYEMFWSETGLNCTTTTNLAHTQYSAPTWGSETPTWWLWYSWSLLPWFPWLMSVMTMCTGDVIIARLSRGFTHNAISKPFFWVAIVFTSFFLSKNSSIMHRNKSFWTSRYSAFQRINLEIICIHTCVHYVINTVLWKVNTHLHLGLKVSFHI